MNVPTLGDSRQSRWQGVAQVAEAVAKIAAVGGIVLYGVGLLVTNVYLARFGLTDFSVVKPQCLFVGVWALILLALASAPVAIFTTVISESKKGVVARLATALVFAVAVCYLSSFFAWLGFLLFGSSPAPDHLATLDIGIPSWRLLLAIMNILPMALIAGEASRRTLMPADKYALTLGPGVALGVIGLLVIGSDMFVYVNAEAGGGRPTEALLDFTSEGKAVVSHIRQMTRTSEDKTSESGIESLDLRLQAQLAYVSSERYVITIGYCEPSSDRKTVNARELRALVDKKIVQAVYLIGPALRISAAERCTAVASTR